MLFPLNAFLEIFDEVEKHIFFHRKGFDPKYLKKGPKNGVLPLILLETFFGEKIHGNGHKKVGMAFVQIYSR